MLQGTRFDWDLIQRYDAAGPRYTSYPTAVQFHDRFQVEDYLRQTRISNDIAKPLSLYLHIPFCRHLCFYCACNKVVTKNRAKGEEYLQRLTKEIRMQARLFDGARVVRQLHFGGGTPTWYDLDQLRGLVDVIADCFSLSEDPDRDFSIEIDPRTVDQSTIAGLRELGFNRMSIGVQDFDPRVQEAVHRVQPSGQTLSTLNAARAAGVKSVNVDLIYGLPLQSRASFSETLDAVIAADPDRVCIFNYAHLPERFAPQRRIKDEELPPAEERLTILQTAVATLSEAGYRYIGMDHFAKPDDELSQAQDRGDLHRNFQGYSTHAECDLIGLGVSSISSVADCYSQSHHGLGSYYDCIDQDRLPVLRGLTLDADDRLRRDVINRLMCFGKLEMAAVEAEHRIDFADYFAPELERLKLMQQDGLLETEPGRLVVTPRGWALVRNICTVFDKYLARSQGQRFSRMI